MRKILLFTIIVLSLGMIISCGNKEDSKNSKPITIQLSHNQPESSSEHAGAKAFKKKLEELSGGSMVVEIFPAQQLGSMREQAERSGVSRVEGAEQRKTQREHHRRLP